MKWWRRFRGATRMSAGDGIAAVLLVGCLAFIIWGVATNIWVAIAGALHPSLGSDQVSNLDLIAQRGMNLAAWAMVALTGLSLLVGIVTLVLLRQNLIEARAVSREASRSAMAAEDAVAVAREATAANAQIGKIQVRAYLAVTDVTSASTAVDASSGISS